MVAVLSVPFRGTPAHRALQRDAKFLLPAGVKLAALGSSSIERNTGAYSTSPPMITGQASGGLTYARMRDPRFDFTNWFDLADPLGRKMSGGNFGKSGSGMAQQAELVGTIIARGYGACLLQLGQNDLIGPEKVPALLAKYEDLFLRPLKAAGVACYVATLNPRAHAGTANNGSALPLGDPFFRKRLEFNAALPALCDKFGAELIDSGPYLEDPASPVRAARAGVSEDGLHLTPLGCWLWSAAAQEVFARTIEPGSGHLVSSGAPGNLFSNGLLAGSAGIAGLGASGTLPDKVRASTLGGAAITGFANSIVADPGAGNAIRSTISLASATGDVVRWLFTDFPGTSASSVSTPGLAGIWLRAMLRVFVESGAEHLQDLGLFLRPRSTSTGADLFQASEATSNRSATEPVADGSMNGRSLWFVTEPMLCPAGSEFLNFSLEAYLAGSGVVVMEVSQPRLWAVSNPRFWPEGVG